jgi:hypothetical protein
MPVVVSLTVTLKGTVVADPGVPVIVRVPPVAE